MPKKGEKLTDEQKRDDRLWRFIGRWTCCSLDAYAKRHLYYLRGRKSIRVEDTDGMMAWAPIVQSDLIDNDLGLTMDEFEQWLISKGLPKRREKRARRSYSLYD